MIYGHVHISLTGDGEMGDRLSADGYSTEREMDDEMGNEMNEGW